MKPNAVTVFRTSGLNPILERCSVTLKNSGLELLEVLEVDEEAAAVEEVDLDVEAVRAAVASVRRNSIIVVTAVLPCRSYECAVCLLDWDECKVNEATKRRWYPLDSRQS